MNLEAKHTTTRKKGKTFVVFHDPFNPFALHLLCMSLNSAEKKTGER